MMLNARLPLDVTEELLEDNTKVHIDKKLHLGGEKVYISTRISPDVSQLKNIDRLYHALLQQQVASLTDITTLVSTIVGRQVSNSHARKTYVEPLMKDGRVERVKRELYVIGVPSKEGLRFPTAEGLKAESPDKFVVASKIAEHGFLGFHTALEFHGVSQSIGWQNVNICVDREKRFRKFEYRGIVYQPIGVSDIETGVITKRYKGQRIRVTSPERTFVDCIDRPDLGGGWEEMMKSVSELPLRDPKSLVQMTIASGRQSLIRKVGFVLDVLENESSFITGIDHISMNELEQSVKGPVQYLFRDPKLRQYLGGTVLNARWNLYVPRNFWSEFVRGV